MSLGEGEGEGESHLPILDSTTLSTPPPLPASPELRPATHAAAPPPPVPSRREGQRRRRGHVALHVLDHLPSTRHLPASQPEQAPDGSDGRAGLGEGRAHAPADAEPGVWREGGPEHGGVHREIREIVHNGPKEEEVSQVERHGLHLKPSPPWRMPFMHPTTARRLALDVEVFCTHTPLRLDYSIEPGGWRVGGLAGWRHKAHGWRTHGGRVPLRHGRERGRVPIGLWRYRSLMPGGGWETGVVHGGCHGGPQRPAATCSPPGSAPPSLLLVSSDSQVTTPNHPGVSRCV